MWTPNEAKLVKIALHNNGEDVETPWAEDLGPHPSRPWQRLVRLANVPFLHAKPTYEDVLAVEEDEALGRLAWNASGLPYEELRIHEDSGRWGMIIDYRLTNADDDLTGLFQSLGKVGSQAGMALEGAYSDKAKGSGRAYAAVPGHYEVEDAFNVFAQAGLPLELTLIHPVDDEDEE